MGQRPAIDLRQMRIPGDIRRRETPENNRRKLEKQANLILVIGEVTSP
jgi:hypothetical protein